LRASRTASHARPWYETAVRRSFHREHASPTVNRPLLRASRTL
jgi:hypothetical protein